MLDEKEVFKIPMFKDVKRKVTENVSWHADNIQSSSGYKYVSSFERLGGREFVVREIYPFLTNYYRECLVLAEDVSNGEKIYFRVSGDLAEELMSVKDKLPVRIAFIRVSKTVCELR